MNFNEILEKKKNNQEWTYEEIDKVVSAFTFDKLSEEDMSKFLMLIYKQDLTYKETLDLTTSMIKTGKIMKFNTSKKIVDKHSTGGVGDKVTLLIAPIVAASGLVVAKMSGKSLGLTGGTIDKLESIEGYKVNLTKEEFNKQINEIDLCVMSQTEEIATSDKKIYAIRDKIGAVDSIPLIASSIMSKKIASGSDVIVIDLKVGKGAFMKDATSAKKLANTMIQIGKDWNKETAVILTDMNAPLGFTVGNALEVEEVIDFFNGKREKRLEKVVITLSSLMISKGKKISLKEATKLATSSLESGKAKELFYKWIKAQGGNITKLKNQANIIEVKSEKDGYINEIDANKIAQICNELGAGRTNKRKEVDYAVGIKLTKTLYEKVQKGETLAKVYYNKEVENLTQKTLDAFKISSIIKEEKDIIIEVIE